TASFVRAIERFAGDLCLHFLPLFQQIVAIRKTCNQLRDKLTRSGGSGPRVPHHRYDLTQRKMTGSTPKAVPPNAPIHTCKVTCSPDRTLWPSSRKHRVMAQRTCSAACG